MLLDDSTSVTGGMANLKVTSPKQGDDPDRPEGDEPDRPEDDEPHRPEGDEPNKLEGDDASL